MTQLKQTKRTSTDIILKLVNLQIYKEGICTWKKKTVSYIYPVRKQYKSYDGLENLKKNAFMKIYDSKVKTE